jgi:hypothetical protein
VLLRLEALAAGAAGDDGLALPGHAVQLLPALLPGRHRRCRRTNNELSSGAPRRRSLLLDEISVSLLARDWSVLVAGAWRVEAPPPAFYSRRGGAARASRGRELAPAAGPRVRRRGRDAGPRGATRVRGTPPAGDTYGRVRGGRASACPRAQEQRCSLPYKRARAYPSYPAWARASMEAGNGGTVAGWRAGAPAMLHCRRVDVLGTRERGEEAGRPADQAPGVASVQGWTGCTRPLCFGGFLSQAWSHEVRRTCRYGPFHSKAMPATIVDYLVT